MVRTTMVERFEGRVKNAARQTFIYVRIPEDATHRVSAFFGQKIVRVYPLRRTHFCDLIRPRSKDRLRAANPTTLTQLCPHMDFLPTLPRLYAAIYYCQAKN